jgi:hypothetical protein
LFLHWDIIILIEFSWINLSTVVLLQLVRNARMLIVKWGVWQDKWFVRWNASTCFVRNKRGRAVHKSLLSKIWVNLWSSSPRLSFSSDEFRAVDNKHRQISWRKATMFKKYVDTVLYRLQICYYCRKRENRVPLFILKKILKKY